MRLNAELQRLRLTISDLSERNDALTRENRQLGGAHAFIYANIASKFA